MAESSPAPLSRNPEIMSGAVVLNGTRVPVTALFDYLDSEGSLAEFLPDRLPRARPGNATPGKTGAQAAYG